MTVLAGPWRKQELMTGKAGVEDLVRGAVPYAEPSTKIAYG